MMTDFVEVRTAIFECWNFKEDRFSREGDKHRTPASVRFSSAVTPTTDIVTLVNCTDRLQPSQFLHRIENPPPRRRAVQVATLE